MTSAPAERTASGLPTAAQLLALGTEQMAASDGPQSGRGCDAPHPASEKCTSWAPRMRWTASAGRSAFRQERARHRLGHAEVFRPQQTWGMQTSAVPRCRATAEVCTAEVCMRHRPSPAPARLEHRKGGAAAAFGAVCIDRHAGALAHQQAGAGEGRAEDVSEGAGARDDAAKIRALKVAALKAHSPAGDQAGQRRRRGVAHREACGRGEEEIRASAPRLLLPAQHSACQPGSA